MFEFSIVHAVCCLLVLFVEFSPFILKQLDWITCNSSKKHSKPIKSNWIACLANPLWLYLIFSVFVVNYFPSKRSRACEYIHWAVWLPSILSELNWDAKLFEGQEKRKLNQKKKLVIISSVCGSNIALLVDAKIICHFYDAVH